VQRKRRKKKDKKCVKSPGILGAGELSEISK
jgi:hypothetical protein